MKRMNGSHLGDEPRRPWTWAAAVFLAALGLVVTASWWSPALQPLREAKEGIHTLVDAFRLLSAALIGAFITFVLRHTRRDQPLTASMEQAHVLLCVAGALTMIIVGDSLARAFGIAGAASLIRFRTPVDDPRDLTVLFLLMALGMAAGLGLVAVAGMGTLFLCACLLLLGQAKGELPRSMKVALVADGQEFPAGHVSNVFAKHHITVAPLEIFHGDHTTVSYRALLAPEASLEEISAGLMSGGTVGIKSVSWAPCKRNH
jgi:hypothetical protein